MTSTVLPFRRVAVTAAHEPQRWQRNFEAFDGAVQDARDAIAQLRDEGMGLDVILLGFTHAMEEASRAEWGEPLRDSLGAEASRRADRRAMAPDNRINPDQ